MWKYYSALYKVIYAKYFIDLAKIIKKDRQTERKKARTKTENLHCLLYCRVYIVHHDLR